MKNLNRILSFSVVVILFVAFSIIPVDAFSQKKSPDETIAQFSDPIAGIFKNSCVGCHSDQSKGKAKTFFNLSEWDKLTVKQKVKEGKHAMKEVNKGNMPPAGFLEKVPGAALTADQKKEITVWAKSIKKNN